MGVPPRETCCTGGITPAARPNPAAGADGKAGLASGEEPAGGVEGPYGGVCRAAVYRARGNVQRGMGVRDARHGTWWAEQNAAGRVRGALGLVQVSMTRVSRRTSGTLTPVWGRALGCGYWRRVDSDGAGAALFWVFYRTVIGGSVGGGEMGRMRVRWRLTVGLSRRSRSGMGIQRQEMVGLGRAATRKRSIAGVSVGTPVGGAGWPRGSGAATGLANIGAARPWSSRAAQGGDQEKASCACLLPERCGGDSVSGCAESGRRATVQRI